MRASTILQGRDGPSSKPRGLPVSTIDTRQKLLACVNDNYYTTLKRWVFFQWWEWMQSCKKTENPTQRTIAEVAKEQL
jgi:hypothetical protein